MNTATGFIIGFFVGALFGGVFTGYILAIREDHREIDMKEADDTWRS